MWRVLSDVKHYVPQCILLLLLLFFDLPAVRPSVRSETDGQTDRGVLGEEPSVCLLGRDRQLTVSFQNAKATLQQLKIPLDRDTGFIHVSRA